MADPTIIDQIAQEITGIESGGNYKAIGPRTKSGDRAYGKYQIMGANIPAWTEEALGKRMGPYEFLRDTDAQEKTARHRLGAYYDQYGNAADVASAWHSGQPLAVAKAQGRKDILGTTTEDYANRVAAGVGGPQASEAGAEEIPQGEIVKLPDGSSVNLGVNPTPEVKAAFRAKVLEKFPQLQAQTEAAAAPEAPPPAHTMPEESSAVSRYFSAVKEPLVGGLKDAYEGIRDLATGDHDLKSMGANALKVLAPLGVPGEVAGNVAWQAATDAGLEPWQAAALGTAVSIATGMAIPMPGVGKAKNVAKAATGAEEAAAALVPSVERRVAAEAALKPISAEEAGGVLGRSSKAGTAARKADVQMGYDAISNAAKDFSAVPKDAEQLAADIENLRIESGARWVEPTDAQLAKNPDLVGQWKGGTIVGQKAALLDEIEAAAKSGEPLSYPQQERFKQLLDDVIPHSRAVEQTPKAARLQRFRSEFKDFMRQTLEDNDPSLAKQLDEVNRRWATEVKPNQRFSGAIGKIDDANVAFERVFGKGKTEQTAAKARRAMNLASESERAQLQRGFVGTMIRAATENGELDPRKLLKHWDSLNDGFRTQMGNSNITRFMDGIRDQVKLAETLQPKKETVSKLAKLTAKGLRLAGIGAGAAFGHVPGAIAGALIVPEAELAKALSNSKIAGILARAMKTPANSQVVPTIINLLRHHGVGMHPEGEEANGEQAAE